MATVHEIILLFSKYPVAGKSKTRLIPALGAERAAALQREMTAAMAAKIERFRRREQHREQHCAFEIHHEGGTREEMAAWLGDNHRYRRQVPGDLGRRMHSAIASHCGGTRRIVLVGSDCPSVDEALLAAAFRALGECDVVLGPAHDGGYYLVGVRSALSPDTLDRLFSGIPWGGGEVLAATLKRIETLNLSCRLLATLHDIDTPEDLVHLDHHPDT